MCAVGAKGETRRVMADLIGAPQGVVEQNRQYAALLKSVNGEGERPFQMVTANALWGQVGYHFKSDFRQAIAAFYDGAFNEVNYALPDEAMRTINAWVIRHSFVLSRRFFPTWKNIQAVLSNLSDVLPVE
jgi:serine protease inhibitor